MIGLGQEDEIKEILLGPEIWCHDAVYHEAITVWRGHTQLMFTFSGLGRPRVLVFSERLVFIEGPSEGMNDWTIL